MTKDEAEDVQPQDDVEVNAAVNADDLEVGAESDPLLELQQQRDQFRDQFLRTAAEMENFRKRVNRERQEERKYASYGFISELLPIIDNLQRAVDAASGEEGDAGVLQGVQMVLKQFEDVLTRNGAEPIEALGQQFDPNLHEALQQRPTDEVPPMTVVQVLERGYKLHDRVIRPTKVIVSSELT